MSFEEKFFGPGNRISWQSISSGALPAEAAERLAPFLEDFRTSREIVALPRVTLDKKSQWYFLCASERHARLARDLVRAFLGPSYSDLDNQPAPLQPSDPIDTAVIARYNGNAFRITIVSQQLVGPVRERLHLLMTLRREQPVRDPHRLRPVGRILRDFEFSLQSRDERTAAALIAEVRHAGYLSANNLVFLEVLRLSSVDNWHAILALPELALLLAIDCPRRVTEALIRAVYAVHLQEFEQGRQIREALERFMSRVLPTFGSLYRSRALLGGFAVDASFALAAAATQPAQLAVVNEIQQAYTQGTSERAYIDAIAAIISPSTPASELPSLTGARAAYAEGRIDTAYAIALSLKPSFERSSILLLCASEMATLTVAQVALEAAAGLPTEQRQRIDGNASLRRIRVALEEVVGGGGGAIAPTSWPEWLERLKDPVEWKGALPAAETGAREWSLQDLLDDQRAILQIADLLVEERPSWAKTALLDSLPHILSFLGKHGPDARLRVVYDSLYLLLATDADVSLPQLDALLNVIEIRVGLGIDKSAYTECLGVLADSIHQAATPAVVSLDLDAIEALVMAPCPSPDSRNAFVGSAAALFQRWSRWIAPAQWLLLQELAAELEISLVIPQQELLEPRETNEWAALSGKKICLYSLNEAALRRATSVITRLSPNASTQSFHDLAGGSNALKTAARTADIFVVATGSATHAATTFIDSNRPSSATTLRTRGKGSSSILDTLQRHLRQETS
ncbi:MAG TPA: protein DpdD [Gemmatimonadaceae bacterium]|nr:protein DpdD [Gemmatimonadaceae bacterium]